MNDNHSGVAALATSPAAAAENDFATFNSQPHLCVDVPDGGFTITCRTSEGEKVTFAFQPYVVDKAPQCIDIQHHHEDGDKITMNGDVPLPVQRLIAFGIGTQNFRATATDTRPTTLVSLLID